jgi:proline iminopeptidase
MQTDFYRQGAAGIVKARAVEDRLRAETWERLGYDLLPRASELRIPTLVMASDHDFIPVEFASHIAQAIPGAKLVIMKDCGHFSYLECPDAVRRALDAFDARAP